MRPSELIAQDAAAAAPDCLVDAAREWLTWFRDMYGGSENGEREPTRSALSHASWFLKVGPSPGDPFTICGLMIGAAPDDNLAKTLASFWCDTYQAALRETDRQVGIGFGELRSSRVSVTAAQRLYLGLHRLVALELASFRPGRTRGSSRRARSLGSTRVEHPVARGHPRDYQLARPAPSFTFAT
jgi:hypothetical protein